MCQVELCIIERPTGASWPRRLCTQQFMAGAEAPDQQNILVHRPDELDRCNVQPDNACEAHGDELGLDDVVISQIMIKWHCPGGPRGACPGAV